MNDPLAGESTRNASQEQAGPGLTSGEIKGSFEHIGNLNIHVLQSGLLHHHRQVLLLHGGSSDSAWLSWKHTLPALGSTARVVAPDLPGFGLSDTPDIDYSLDFYAGFVEEFVRESDLTEPVLVGFSMGGWIALELVLENRIRARSLVLVDSAGYHSSIPFPRLASFLLPFPRFYFSVRSFVSRHPDLLSLFLRYVIEPAVLTRDPVLLLEIAEEMRQAGAGKAWRSFLEQELVQSQFRRSCGARLSDLSLPVLLIHGRKDRLVPVEWAEEAHEKISNSRLQIFENCGHWPSREWPNRFNRVLQEFIEEVNAKPHDS